MIAASMSALAAAVPESSERGAERVERRQMGCSRPRSRGGAPPRSWARGAVPRLRARAGRGARRSRSSSMHLCRRDLPTRSEQGLRRRHAAPHPPPTCPTCQTCPQAEPPRRGRSSSRRACGPGRRASRRTLSPRVAHRARLAALRVQLDRRGRRATRGPRDSARPPGSARASCPMRSMDEARLPLSYQAPEPACSVCGARAPRGGADVRRRAWRLRLLLHARHRRADRLHSLRPAAQERRCGRAPHRPWLARHAPRRRCAPRPLGACPAAARRARARLPPTP